MAKEITNEDLAIMIKNGFDGQDKKFKAHDEKFSGVDKRLDKIEETEKKLILDNVIVKDDLNIVKNDVKEIKQNVEKILNSVDGIAKNYKDVKAEQISNQGAHQRIQQDVNEVRNHVGMSIKNPSLEPEGV